MSAAFDSFVKGLNAGQDFFHDRPQQRAIRQQAMDQQKTLFDQQQTDRTNLKDAWQTVGDKAWDSVDSPMARTELVRRAHQLYTTTDINVARTEAMELFNSTFWSDWRKEHGITGRIVNMGYGSDGVNENGVWMLFEGPDGKPQGLVVDADTFEADLVREVTRLGDPDALQAIGRRGGRAPLSVRNNNPGALRSASGGDIREFATENEGWAAFDRQLQRYANGEGVAGRPRVTVADIVTKWAPARVGNEHLSPGELRRIGRTGGADNTTEQQRNYIAFVAQQLGVDPNEQLPMQDPAFRQRLMGAMASFEAGQTRQHPALREQPAGLQVAAAAAPEQEPSAAAQLADIEAKETRAMFVARREQRDGLRASMEQLEPQIAQMAETVRRLEEGLRTTFEAQKASTPTPEDVAEHAKALRNVHQARAGLAALQEQRGAGQQQLEQMDAEDAERHAAEAEEKKAELAEQAAAEAEAAREAATGTPKGFAGRLGEMFSPKRIMERAEARGGDMYEVEPLRPDASLPQYPPQWMRDFREGQGRPIEPDPIVVQGTPEPEVPAAETVAPSATPAPAAPSAAPAGLGTQTQGPRTLQNNPQLVQGMAERLRMAQAPGGLGGSGPLAGRSTAVQERERKALVELAFQGKITAQQFENYIRTGSFDGSAKSAERKIQHIKDGIVFDSAYGGYIDVAELMGRPKEELAPKDLRQRLQLESDTWDMAWDVVGLPKAMRDGPMAASFRHDFNVMAESMGFEPLQFLLGNLDSGDGKQGSQALLASVYRNHRWIKENSGSTWWKPWTYFNQLNVNSTTIAYQMSMHGYVNNEKEGLNRIRQDYYDPLQQEYKNWAAKDERPRRMSEAQTAAYSTAISDMVLRGGKSLDEARQEVFMIGRESGWNPDAVNSYLSRGR
jgi:hypothetical protein